MRVTLLKERESAATPLSSVRVLYVSPSIATLACCVIISVDMCGVQSILVGGLDSLQWGKESVHTGKLLLASPRSRVWLASMRV